MGTWVYLLSPYHLVLECSVGISCSCLHPSNQLVRCFWRILSQHKPSVDNHSHKPTYQKNKNKKLKITKKGYSSGSAEVRNVSKIVDWKWKVQLQRSTLHSNPSCYQPYFLSNLRFVLSQWSRQYWCSTIMGSPDCQNSIIIL